MKNRFTIFRRGTVWYYEDRKTGQQKSLNTRDPEEARKLVQAKNDAVNLPLMNINMAKAYLNAIDPKITTRTWADVMERFCCRSNPASKMRNERVVRTRPMQFLRDKKLIETTADDILTSINMGSTSTIIFLQTLHNDALGMGWIPQAILPRKLWPRTRKKERRAITLEQHKMICNSLSDPEWRLYLGLLWFTGASQTDAANLTSANIDWGRMALSYRRKKLEGRELDLPAACIGIGKGLEEVLRQSPSNGPLFPGITKMNDRSRACFFWKLCKKFKFEHVSLHSYRYSFAERAKIAGIPARWAMSALGHNSKAVHDAYARNAQVVCPAIDGEHILRAQTANEGEVGFPINEPYEGSVDFTQTISPAMGSGA